MLSNQHEYLLQSIFSSFLLSQKLLPILCHKDNIYCQNRRWFPSLASFGGNDLVVKVTLITDGPRGFRELIESLADVADGHNTLISV